ncbi:MAG: hypothetical protein IJ399_05085 [Bacilli bacterium]|nr:hypothetical protein [Bacilli bacterium]MBQ8534470.1 hypothetical protein [Bacilli bacterium]
MEEDIRGQFVIRDKGNGIKYKMYVPENVNADTPVFTYALGSGDPGIEKCVLEQGSDSIFIVTVVDYSNNIDKVTMNIVDEVKQEFGVTSTVVTPSGFSLGGPVGYKTAAENIRRNPGCEPQTVFLVDAYGTYFYNPKLHLDDQDTINLFKENNTVFFALDHPLKTTDVNTQYAKAGLNIIQVKCIGQGHGDINASFFNEKMYDYMAGQALPKDGYVYSMYNSETGEWEEIPYEKIATRYDLNSYFGMDTLTSNIERLNKLPDITVKSDDKTLESYLNNIRSSIRNTNFLTANFNTSYGSTTQVPTAIPKIIAEFFTSTSTLLNKIATKTSQIANISVEIENLDNDIAKKASLLNEQTLTGTAVQTGATLLTNNTTNDIENTKQINNQTDTTKNENINQTVSQQEITTTNNDKKTSETVRKPSTPTYQKNNSIEDQFIEYEKLYSTNDKTVYNYNDKYKVVIHHENGRITSVEHYYNYKNSEEAIKAVGQLNIDYKNVENFNKIIQKDNLVKVIFKEEMFKNIPLEKFKENYKALEEVLEQL